jgi:hypothetical protein
LSGRSGQRAGRTLAALVALAVLLPGVSVRGQGTALRLLVFDLPYSQVWGRAVEAMKAYPLARAADGVIETQRVERAPLPEEAGMERVAERITVRLESRSEGVTRVTVGVQAEGFRNGGWQAMDASPTAVRAVLDRIRAALG